MRKVLLPNRLSNYKRMSLYFVQNFPHLIRFNESRRVNSVIFSYLGSLKEIVKYNAKGVPLSWLVIEYDNGVIVCLAQFLFCKLVH